MSRFFEFDCRDCGKHVQRFAQSADQRCLICGFVAQVPVNEGREALRAELLDADEMRHWKHVGCYRDEAFDERPCNWCEKPYRGPSAYCCFECAIADGVPAA